MLYEIQAEPRPILSSDLATVTQFARQLKPEDNFSCEPPSLKVLVISEVAATSAKIEHCLTHMSAYEPRITLASTVSAARFALRSDDFDAVILASSAIEANCMDLLLELEIGLTESNAILVTDGRPPCTANMTVIDKSALNSNALQQTLRAKHKTRSIL